MMQVLPRAGFGPARKGGDNAFCGISRALTQQGLAAKGKYKKVHARSRASSTFRAGRPAKTRRFAYGHIETYTQTV